VWFVCFLQLGNGDIYVGSTNNLERRLSSHQEGQVQSTKAHLPIALKS
jgi:predicted GIY-YIG superfamily endonuclease